MFCRFWRVSVLLLTKPEHSILCLTAFTCFIGMDTQRGEQAKCLSLNFTCIWLYPSCYWFDLNFSSFSVPLNIHIFLGCPFCQRDKFSPSHCWALMRWFFFYVFPFDVFYSFSSVLWGFLSTEWKSNPKSCYIHSFLFYFHYFSLFESKIPVWSKELDSFTTIDSK